MCHAVWSLLGNSGAGLPRREMMAARGDDKLDDEGKKRLK
jgi:hypothetical protein